MKFFEAKTKTLSHSYLNLLCRFKCSSLIVLELFCLRCRYWISYSKSKCYLLSDSIQLFVFLFVSDWIIDSNIIWANKVSHWHLQRYESNLRLKFLEFHWTRNFFYYLEKNQSNQSIAYISLFQNFLMPFRSLGSFSFSRNEIERRLWKKNLENAILAIIESIEKKLFHFCFHFIYF